MARVVDFLKSLRGRRSGGMRVSEAVHRHIAAGDRHRDAGRPALAATAYAEAVEADPRLYHIWVQLGHALKDSGDAAAARTAYEHARLLRPEAGEPLLFLGQIERREGRRTAAARHFLAAARSEDAEADAGEEAMRIIGMPRPVDLLLARRLIAALSPDAIAATTAPAAAGTRLIFDVTDLIAHVRAQRRPTGIQRVELEVSLAALEDAADGAAICAFVVGRDELVAIDTETFRRIAQLATTDDDPGDESWEAALFGLLAHLFFAPPLSARVGDVLVNLGTSWSIHDYFRIVRNLKAEVGLTYAAFVHDLIPIVRPEFCRDEVVTEYVTWFLGACRHVDLFLVNSASTQHDLLAAAHALGRDLDPDHVRRIAFDVAFDPPGEPLASDHLGKWGLVEGGFALFVSTLEPRKNHLLAFDAWCVLIATHGAERVPHLVCVGRSGWLNDAIFARLEGDETLAAKVTIIDQASDRELALLYGACRFLLYPSHYEGWGLPISEALSFGKVPVVADTSSLVEAGGGFAVSFASDSVPALVTAVEQVAFDAAWREAREDAIRRAYRPRRWRDLTTEIREAVSVFARTHTESYAPPLLAPGTPHALALKRASEIPPDAEGWERLRIGDGWLWPEEDGCRVKAGGGTIAFAVAGTPDTIGIRLCLRGLASEACGFAVRFEGEAIVTGTLAPGEMRWVHGTLSPRGKPVELAVTGDRTEMVDLQTYADVRPHEASIAVVAVAWDDVASATVP